MLTVDIVVTEDGYKITIPGMYYDEKCSAPADKGRAKAIAMLQAAIDHLKSQDDNDGRVLL